MNLYFRLLVVILSYLLRRNRCHPLEIGRLRFRVWPSDLDLNLHMNNGRYLGMMDLGRFDLMLRAGLVSKGIVERWMPVVADLKIRYRQSLNPFQSFELHTRLVGWDRKWFYLEQRFVSQGKLMARALVRTAFVGQGRTLSCEEIVNAMGLEITSPPVGEEFLSGWVSRPSTQILPSFTPLPSPDSQTAEAASQPTDSI